MPDHKTHDQIGLVAAAVLIPSSYAALHYGLDAAPAAAYSGMLLVVGSHLWATWMLSPDLDINSAIYERWGPLRWLWLPYQTLTPHRSWFSHSGISGAFRLVYLALAVWMMLWVLTWFGQAALRISETPAYHDQFWSWLTSSVQAAGPWPAALIVAGVVIADLVHVVADLVTSEIKGLWR